MENNKKKRSENWSNEEKGLLRQLIADSANIIENKQNKTEINLQKVKEWKNISKRLNEITQKNRSDNEVKLAWKRMKLAAKANLSLHRRQTSQTGGGEKPPSPNEEDLEIMAIAPHDFSSEQNVYDSDGAHATEIHVPILPAPPAVPNSSLVEQTNIDDTDMVLHVMSEPEDKKTIKKTNEKPDSKVTKKNSQKTNKTEDMRLSIVRSNVELKQRKMEIMEEEHRLNLKIAELKIKKLQLEISILENQKTDI